MANILLLSYEDFISIFNNCISILDQIKNELIDSILEERYLKKI